MRVTAKNETGAEPSAPINRHRCFLQFTTALSETCVHPFVQLRARSAELAARLALAVTGALAVVEVQRLEEST